MTTITPTSGDSQQFINAIFGNYVSHAITGTELQSGKILHKFGTDPTFEAWSEQQKYFNTCTTDGTLTERGNPSRKNAACAACHAIVCDDVGTKAKAPPVEPSWILETSAGNFQYGYLIEPATDFDTVSQFVSALILAGYSDKGATGFNRLFRVPGSFHKKTGVTAALRAWNGKRWALTDLIASMGVPLRQQHKPATVTPADVALLQQRMNEHPELKANIANYIRKRADNLLDDLANASSGERNTLLNNVGMELFGYVIYGTIERDYIWSELWRASVLNGEVAVNAPGCERTMNSALGAAGATALPYDITSPSATEMFDGFTPISTLLPVPDAQLTDTRVSSLLPPLAFSPDTSIIQQIVDQTTVDSGYPFQPEVKAQIAGLADHEYQSLRGKIKAIKNGPQVSRLDALRVVKRERNEQFSTMVNTTGHIIEPVGTVDKGPWFDYYQHNYYCIENYGGKPVVFNRFDETNQHMLVHDFIRAKSHTMVADGVSKAGDEIFEIAAKWWYENEKATRYYKRSFHPDRSAGEFLTDDGRKIMNTWEGFAVQPVAGTWENIQFFLFFIICNSNQVKYEWLMAWLTQLFCEPHIKSGIALVLQSKTHGAGKNNFINFLSHMIGQRMVLTDADSETFVGGFNDAIFDKLLLVANEAFAANDKTIDGKLKSIVTEQILWKHPKGVGRTPEAHSARMIFLSNHDWVVNLEAEDRRTVVFRLMGWPGATRQQWGELIRNMHAEAGAFLNHMLLNPVSFETMPPLLETIERTEQIVDSFKGLQRVAYEILQNGEMRNVMKNQAGFQLLTSEGLKEIAKEHHYNVTIPKKLAELLTPWEWGMNRFGQRTIRSARLATLNEARKHFAEKINVKIEWDLNVDEWVIDF